MRRRVLFVPIGVGLLVLGVLFWVTRTSDLEASLVAAVSAMESNPPRRTSHVSDPRAGSFGEAIVPLLPTLVELHKNKLGVTFPIEEYRTLKDVQLGRQPVSALPASVLRIRSESAEVVHAALAATRRDLPNLAAPIAGFDPDGDSVLSLQTVASLAALEIRFLLEAKRADAAIETCADGLALARDLSFGPAALHRAVSGTIISTLLEPCGAAFDSAEPASRRKGLEALSGIRAAMPTSAFHERADGYDGELQLFGRLLSAAGRSKLSPDARSRADKALIPASWLERMKMRRAWRDYVAIVDRVTASADLPFAERMGDASTRAHAWTPAPVREVLSIAGILIVKDRVALSHLDTLRTVAAVELFRLETGAWPLSPADLVTRGTLDAIPLDGNEKPLEFFVDKDTLYVGGDPSRVPKAVPFGTPYSGQRPVAVHPD